MELEGAGEKALRLVRAELVLAEREAVAQVRVAVLVLIGVVGDHDVAAERRPVLAAAVDGIERLAAHAHERPLVRIHQTEYVGGRVVLPAVRFVPRLGRVAAEHVAVLGLDDGDGARSVVALVVEGARAKAVARRPIDELVGVEVDVAHARQVLAHAIVEYARVHFDVDQLAAHVARHELALARLEAYELVGEQLAFVLLLEHARLLVQLLALGLYLGPLVVVAVARHEVEVGHADPLVELGLVLGYRVLLHLEAALLQIARALGLVVGQLAKHLIVIVV